LFNTSGHTQSSRALRHRDERRQWRPAVEDVIRAVDHIEARVLRRGNCSRSLPVADPRSWPSHTSPDAMKERPRSSRVRNPVGASRVRAKQGRRTMPRSGAEHRASPRQGGLSAGTLGSAKKSQRRRENPMSTRQIAAAGEHPEVVISWTCCASAASPRPGPPGRRCASFESSSGTGPSSCGFATASSPRRPGSFATSRAFCERGRCQPGGALWP